MTKGSYQIGNGEMIEQEILTKEERIQELQDELKLLEGNSPELSTTIAKLFKNPSQLQRMFNLDERQVRNVKSVASGFGSGMANKYLGKAFGDELASAMGGFIAAYIARRVFK